MAEELNFTLVYYQGVVLSKMEFCSQNLLSNLTASKSLNVVPMLLLRDKLVSVRD
jgi:hypothetical protein